MLVLRERIPVTSLEAAADHLTEYLGPEGIELAGGKTWWRQRINPEEGMHCEWISMKRDWDGADIKKSKKQHLRRPAEQPDPPTYHGELEDQRCMYYVSLYLIPRTTTECRLSYRCTEGDTVNDSKQGAH